MEKKVIMKKDWISNFNLIGVPKINDYTFKINEKSEKSSWVYNSLNLGIDCGEKRIFWFKRYWIWNFTWRAKLFFRKFLVKSTE